MENDRTNAVYNAYGSQTRTVTFAALMRNVYLWMTLGLVMTALTAAGVASNLGLVSSIATNRMLFYGLCIAELALVWILAARIMRMSFLTAGLMFAAYSILNGVTLSIIFVAYTMTSIAQTFFITAGTFAVMTVVGYTIKKDLSAFGRVLIMLLVGLIIATLVNMFMQSSGLAIVLNYLGVLIFVGLTAYDTQKIKNMLIAYGDEPDESAMKIALMGSLMLYLDFINLFLYLLRFFGSSRD